MYTILAGLLLQRLDFIHQLSPEFFTLLKDGGSHFLGKCLHESHVCHEVVEKVLKKPNKQQTNNKKPSKSLLFKRDHTPTAGVWRRQRRLTEKSSQFQGLSWLESGDFYPNSASPQDGQLLIILQLVKNQ